MGDPDAGQYSEHRQRAGIAVGAPSGRPDRAGARKKPSPRRRKLGDGNSQAVLNANRLSAGGRTSPPRHTDGLARNHASLAAFIDTTRGDASVGTAAGEYPDPHLRTGRSRHGNDRPRRERHNLAHACEFCPACLTLPCPRYTGPAEFARELLDVPLAACRAIDGKILRDTAGTRYRPSWAPGAESTEERRQQLAPERFMEEIAQYTARVIRENETERVDEHSWGSCPRCGRPVIPGKRGYGCSGWKDGCKFVLWPTHKDRQLDTADIRELLQRRVLLRPVELSDSGQVILALTGTGEVTEIAVPRQEQQTGKIKEKRSGSSRSRKRSTEGGKEDSVGAVPDTLGNCPLCAAEVREQPKSYSCSGWKQGCKFVIWKKIAGKRISSPMAKTLLTKGQTRQLKGFKSKAGKPFETRLKLVDGEVQLDFSS